MTKVWKDAPYSAEKLVVLLALADWSDHSGECWPSYPKLAQKARISERGAIKIVDCLVRDGVLAVTSKGSGRGHPNRYKILFHKLTKGEPHSLNDEQCLRNTDSGSTQRVNGATTKGERRNTTHIEEPSENRQKEPLGKNQPALPGLPSPLPPPMPRNKARAESESEVIEFCRSLDLPDTDGHWFWCKMAASGWRNDGKPVADWRATVRVWKLSGYFPSIKRASLSTPTLAMQINATKALLDETVKRLQAIHVPDAQLYPKEREAALAKRAPLVEEKRKHTERLNQLNRQAAGIP